MNLNGLREGIARSRRHHEQLVLVEGEAASQLLIEATGAGDLPMLNVGKELSARLLEVAATNRPKIIASILTDLIEQQKTETLLLDHIEIMFDRSLSMDPLKLLQTCSKSTTLVVAWPGTMLAASLVYATPNHPEYRSYKASTLSDLVIVRANESEKENI